MDGPELLNKLGTLLFDPDGDVWNNDEKTSAVNEAINTIVLLRPDAAAVTESTALTADTPKQSIPSTGLRFLDIVMNTGGAPVRKIKREVLNETIPAWTTTTGSAIKHVMFDEENPKIFWVYPVPLTGFSVELTFAKKITEFTSKATSLGLDDIYIAPIIEYVLHRCLGMPGKGSDMGKSARHLSNFYNALGVKHKADAILKQVQES